MPLSQRTVCRIALLANLLLAPACSRDPRDYLQLGETPLKQGERADAALSFQRAAKADPKSAEAWPALVRAVESAPGDLSLKIELGELALEAYATEPAAPAVPL